MSPLSAGENSILLGPDTFKIFCVCKDRPHIHHICLKGCIVMKDCLGCNSGFHEGQFFLLTLLKFLQQSQVVYTHLEATVLILFFVKVAKLNRCTYKGPSEQFLFFHEAFCKVHNPLCTLFHQTNTLEKHNFSNYKGNITYVCVPLLQFRVSWSSEIQYDVMYL